MQNRGMENGKNIKTSSTSFIRLQQQLALKTFYLKEYIRLYNDFPKCNK
jgi:hypothetical protein